MVEVLGFQTLFKILGFLEGMLGMLEGQEASVQGIKKLRHLVDGSNLVVLCTIFMGGILRLNNPKVDTCPPIHKGFLGLIQPRDKALTNKKTKKPLTFHINVAHPSILGQ